MGDGSRASTSSGSRARISTSESGVSGSRTRMLYLTAPASFLERDSAGIGLVKAEVAAKTIRLVSNRGLKRVVMMPLTKGQEGGKDTNKLHCGC